MILVNIRLPASSWKTVPIPSPDITAINIFGEAFGTVQVVNIYNNCDNNTALDTLGGFLRSPEATRCLMGMLRYI
jgi:hypothetical protein